MTMPDDPDFLDELLTRYLDGDATDDEIARVEADASLAARAADIRGAIDLVAAPIAIPEADLDRIRAAALAHSATSVAVTDLDARRGAQLQRRNRVLAAAAVFVFLAVGYAAIQTNTDDDDSTALDSGADTAADDGGDDSALFADSDDAGDDMAEDEGDDGDAAGDMAADAEIADDEAATEAAEATTTLADTDDADDDSSADTAVPFETLDVLPDDLGAVGDIAELAERLSELKSLADEEARFSPPSPDPLDGVCAPVVELLSELVADLAAVETAPVEVAGLAQQVAIGTGVDGSMAAVLIADDACQILEVLDVAGIDGG